MLMQHPINDRQSHVHHQHKSANFQQARRQFQSLDEMVQTSEPQDNHQATRSTQDPNCSNPDFIQSGLADQDKWDQNEHVFQGHQQRGIIEDPSSCQEYGGHDEQDLVKL